MNGFNLQLSKAIGRKEIVRDNGADMNSSFTSVNVLVESEKNGAGIFVTKRMDNGSERPTFITPYAVNMTTESHLVLFAIRRIKYGQNDKQGASVLKGIVQWFESPALSNTVYAVAHMEETDAVDATLDTPEQPATRRVVIDTFLRRERKDGDYSYWETSDGFESPLTAQDKDCIEQYLMQFIVRLEQGKKPQDQRKETWDGNTLTNYGAWKRQNAANKKK